jgi:magnesium transporter
MITTFKYSMKAPCEEKHEAVAALPSKGEFLWLDLEAPTQQEAEVLSQVFNFHPLAIEDCWHEPQAPKLDDYGDYLFIVVHGVRYDASADDFTTHELNIFLGSNYLVTFHAFHSRSIEATQQTIRRNASVMGRGMDFLLHQVLDRVVDNYFPKLEILEDKIETLERLVFTDPGSRVLTTIFEVRRHVIHLKRLVSQEREVLITLSQGEYPFVSQKAQIYFKDIYDHLFRIVDIGDNHMETLNIILQAYLSMISNKLNNTMRVLTVIATLMLPLTVITGVYGMNFEYMPELKSPYGYPAVLLFMLLVAGAMLYYFRRQNWL